MPVTDISDRAVTLDDGTLIATIVAGKPVSDEKVWEGAEGLEWTVPTPAPYHTFETPPKIDPAHAHT